MSVVAVQPVTSERWADVREVFGEHGADGHCWCMYWRLKGEDFQRGCRDRSNRAALQDLVTSGTQPGLIAYADEHPVGWVAVAPRAAFGRIRRSATLRPVDGSDDEAVWSVNCFVVHPDARRTGVARRLLQAAVEHAAAVGAHAVEGYPVLMDVAPDGEMYTGKLDWFTDAGFSIVRSDSSRRIVVRRDLRLPTATDLGR